MMQPMKITEAYERYTIMPNLQLHQLRVAAVAHTLAHALGASVDTVTKAGLLHDMGNILKADLTAFPPDFYGAQDLEYWERVKTETRRFGSDEYEATDAIIREIGVETGVIELINSMGFARAREIMEHGTIEQKIIEYADQRVAPTGITSMHERLREGRERYARRQSSDYAGDDIELYEKSVRALQQIEGELFASIDLSPEEITESALESTIEALREYEIA
jgi:predicted hydrolase (HD superfamily)